jgi:hypothetical protein
MRLSLLRILLGIEYLIAVQVLIGFWSHAGGQYHLDLMFWPWKLAIPLIGAALVVAITSGLAHGSGWKSPRILLMGASLVLLMVVAGVVTYYYHVNEPTDQDDEDQPSQMTRTYFQTAELPGPAGLWSTDHSGARLASKRLLEFRHIRNHAVDPEFGQ